MLLNDPREHLLASPYAAPEVKEAVQRKWVSEAGPRQTKEVNRALSALSHEHNTYTELSGIIGGEERSWTYNSPFGVHNREDVSQVQREIGERFDYTVTRANHQQIIAAVGEALPALHANRPVNDKRITPEQQADQQAKTQKIIQEREAKDKAKAAQIEDHVRELRALYPWAIADGGRMSEQARAAANLRQELALAFPGVKFSVTSDSASMTTGVRYKWELGPCEKAVDAIADKYGYGGFDSSQDLQTIDSSAYGEAVDRVLGRAKHLSGSRHIPDDVYSHIERLLCEAQRVEYAGRQTPHLFGEGDTRWLSDHVYELIARTTFPVGCEITGIESKESGYDELTGNTYETDGYHLTFSAPPEPPAQPVSSEPVTGITITENLEKEGIEIRFAKKPPQSVLDQIRAVNEAAGWRVWRWHKTGKFWYAKANESTRTFAQSLSQTL